MSLKIIGERTSLYTQGYFEYDSKKSGSMTVSHLRICDKPIRSTYRIVEADFIAVHDEKFFHTRDVLSAAKEGAILLVNTVREKEKFFSALPPSVQDTIFKIKLKVFLINAYAVAASMGLGRRINTIMQVCFFKLTPFLTIDEALEALKSHIEQTWGRRGREIVMRNVAGLELALAALEQLDYSQISREQTSGKLATTGENDFVSKVTIPLLRGMGDSLPVSAFPPDGSWPTGTAKLEKRQLATQIPVWQSELCVQCNFCVMICPHAAIRSKIVAPSEIKDPPENFSSLPVPFSEELASYHFVLAVAPEDCTGCGLCIEVCPARDRKMPKRKALVPQDFHTTLGPAKAEWEYFLSLPSVPVREIPPDRRTLVLREPLFEFPGACAGCGETPYIRLLTQLFGDHLVIANATGCSSIYGANLPTTPYTKNNEGQGPAWANSLFEDNAEFGFGISLALAQKEREAFEKLRLLKDKIPPSLWHKVHEKGVGDLWAWQRRKAIQELALYLRDIGEESDFLNSLLPKSVWIIGGDGWAYDIGYGGLDHVLASRQKINILVLDTEVYSNTGGQASKATPLGAAAKFASSGKRTRKKDLGLLAMSYGHVYVAQIALQANSKHAVECFLEAASYPGPSLLLAHCPCIAHGYDLRLSPQQQKRAIASGMWPLYRYNPLLVEKGETPLILDSGKPTLDVAQYMENESRFTMVQLRDPEEYEKLIEMARLAVKQRYAYYEQLSHIHLPKES